MGVGMACTGATSDIAENARHDQRDAFQLDESGATAVEFGLILLPFALLLFAIIETSIVFFTGQALQTAITDASRLILTGQAQHAKDADGNPKPYDAAKFKEEICARFPILFGSVANCTSKILMDVQPFSTFGGSSVGSPINPADKTVDTSAWAYRKTNPGEIVVVRVALEHPMAARFNGSYFGNALKFDLANLSNGNRLIMASAAFRNEPFPTPP